jgi:hypothetical protein
MIYLNQYLNGVFFGAGFITIIALVEKLFHYIVFR